MNFNPARILTLSAATLLCTVPFGAQGQSSTGGSGQSGQSSPSSQTAPPSSNRPMSSMEDSTGNGDSGQTMKDKMFVRKAAEGGMAEVQLGQLASQKASGTDVKDFGQKMVTDHTALNNDMKPIADSMGVMVPKHLNKKDQAEYNKLNGMSGDDFDKEYLAYMVKDHQQDLRDFRGEAASTQDANLRAAVQKGQNVIHEHLMMVTRLAKDKGVAMPEHMGKKSDSMNGKQMDSPMQ